jgi:hypothetical protein
MKTLNEKRVNPDLLKLNTSQKRVLKKAEEAGDPKLAAEQVAAAEDSRNLMAAVKVLVKYKLVITYPPILGPDDEPETVEMTELGKEYAEEYNVADDPALVTPKEQQESEPQGGVADPGTGGEEMMDLGSDDGQGDEGLGLELSSFFLNIDNHAAIVREARHEDVVQMFEKESED